MLCKPAQDITTIAQIAEKAVFFHSELGISTGFPRFPPMCIQTAKRGIKMIDNDSSTILAGSCMLDRLAVIMLAVVSVLVPRVIMGIRCLRKDIGHETERGA